VETRADEPTSSAVENSKGKTNVGTWLVGFYKETVSRVDGDRCPSEPSCSEYSLQAFRKHGFFIGWVMTVDRLIHEGTEETKVSPVVFSGGKKKIYDPVENNDFWWHRSEKP
jgi:putative component of membrane protein insertase Oxa1/YidC/SpoIIIJ protein YidD